VFCKAFRFTECCGLSVRKPAAETPQPAMKGPESLRARTPCPTCGPAACGPRNGRALREGSGASSRDDRGGHRRQQCATYQRLCGHRDRCGPPAGGSRSREWRRPSQEKRGTPPKRPSPPQAGWGVSGRAGAAVVWPSLLRWGRVHLRDRKVGDTDQGRGAASNDCLPHALTWNEQDDRFKKQFDTSGHC